MFTKQDIDCSSNIAFGGAYIQEEDSLLISHPNAILMSKPSNSRTYNPENIQEDPLGAEEQDTSRDKYKPTEEFFQLINPIKINPLKTV